MKKFILVSSLFLGAMTLGFQAEAQCGKSAAAATSCSKEKSSCAAKGTASVEKSEAMLTAMQTQGVEEKVCSHSGTASYYVKQVSETSGEASMTEVAYDSQLGRFVNISPSAGKACCKSGSAEAKACSAKEGASGKACCKGKGSAGTSDAKAVKTSLNQ